MNGKVDLTCRINEELLKRFKSIITLNGQYVDEVIEEMINNYIAESLEEMLQVHKKTSVSKTADSNYRKAVNKIELWKDRPWQNNHKILKAFWELERELGTVMFNELETRCSANGKYPKTYVEKFEGNFNQMKTDKGNSNGKVFNVLPDNKVEIWDEVYSDIIKYKEDFLRS